MKSYTIDTRNVHHIENAAYHVCQPHRNGYPRGEFAALDANGEFIATFTMDGNYSEAMLRDVSGAEVVRDGMGITHSDKAVFTHHGDEFFEAM
jgi:hypothetical protein